MADHLGQQIGNYRLKQLLGQGGFAEVYLGEHVRLGTKAAIKLLHASLTSGEAEAFQREAQIIANLVHPHIVRVLDFDVQRGIPFLVLGYAPNGSLREKHPRGTPVPLALAVSYVQQVGSALQYAHERRLIHRDIKPENMLVGTQGEILLSDFGIASVAHATSSMSTQASMGTLPYMAPEQIRGQPRPASDQYALAVTVYQWISGEQPFQGSSSEIIAQHLAVAPPPLRSKAPHVSPAVERVVMTALEKDPGERFGSVQEFAVALTQASGMGPARVSEISLNAPTISPQVAPTQLAGPGSFAPYARQAPQPVLPGEPAMPVQVPTPMPGAYPPYQVAMAPFPYPLSTSPRQKMNPWIIWLIGTLIITVLGSIAALVIPALIVYRPHTSSSTSSPVAGIGACYTGTGYDPHSGTIQDQHPSDDFSGNKGFLPGTAIYLVCNLDQGADNAITGQLTNNTLHREVKLGVGSIDSAHQRYYNSVKLGPSQEGSYFWELSYNGTDHAATASFTVGFLTHCQVGTGYDVNSGTIQGNSTQFSSGSILYLGCSITSGANQSTITDQLVINDPANKFPIVYNGTGKVDSAHHIYYSSTRVKKTSDYLSSTFARDFLWSPLYKGTFEAAAANFSTY